MLTVNLDAEIIPDTGLGGLTLRTNVREIQELLTGLGVSKEGSSLLVADFEARYVLGKGEVAIGVDVRNGKVFKLMAGLGYRYKLPRKCH